ncbi:hypothetical protein [Chryseobacterium sp. BIGb0232]|uniref:hypothetical protein n=1 Tax=Chryseobacterium sp. BIGb0232 TaxID=2940598 RepID=UPI000F48DC79|nr:hypothetical protein [Chryseobacterium sp. BIGb0232]MCS4305658.1 glutathione synthase/RimK-type ligase-like ATP-grasp enzyme [Chryseobacterium sp. BIGb0232]ROS09632.1 hypothetical protein EDF65_4367 [Chryseobacterium nakagawai]
MVLIISKSDDTPTEQVSNWLNTYKVPFFVLNENIYDVLEINFNSGEIFIGGYSIDMFKVVWFRKFPYALQESQKKDIRNNLYFSLVEYNLIEARALREYLFFELKKRDVVWLTNPFFMTENKLIQMQTAKACGLSVPETFIVNNKKKVKTLVNSGKELITKPFENCVNFRSENRFITMQTTAVNDKLDAIPDYFRPALIQSKIERQFEIRVFYLLGVFFSTKIITNDNTMVDHRISVANDDCRFEIYQLPKDVEEKLRHLLDTFQLNCASVDLIVNTRNEHYFLEINPVGQFTYHSVFNNTYLEIEIALALKKLLKECSIKNT